MELKRICLYRMTHIRNIPHILEHGITHRNSPNSNSHFVAIGDTSLISFRATKTIAVGNEEIVLGDFIPFYFGIRMPMLYVIQHGHNFTTATAPEDIIYLAVSLDKIISDCNLPYYFTDGHATDVLTGFYDKSSIDALPQKIDWEAVMSHFWSGDGIDTDLKRRKQAEFLVKGDIPVDYIVGYVCYNEKAKSRLTDCGIDSEMIKVLPSAYY